jgi:methionyl-tRNA formyltransferase
MNALFLGSKTLGLSIFRCLHKNTSEMKWRIVHPFDVADGRSVLDLFNEYARGNGLDILTVSSAVEAKKIISNYKPDIVLVCGWYWLLDGQTISAAPMGFYGIHNSLLPKYRGGSPLVWSIINGDSEVGATVFRLGSGMDDGGILHQVRVLNTQQDNIATILQKIEKSLVETLPAKWFALLSGSAHITEQDHSLATFCGQRISEDGKIDWGISASKVHNFIRAQTPPYPGAFDYLDGRKLVFLKTEVHGTKYFGTPGQILRRSGESVLISCGDNTTIKVLEVAVDEARINPCKVFPSISIRLG